MGKNNPKHQARKIRAVQTQRYSHGNRTWKYILMFAVGIVAISGVIIGVMTLMDTEAPPDAEVIEPFDEVVLHYRMWIDDNRDGQIDPSKDPFQESENFETEVTSSFEHGRGLIHGFYLEILGLKQRETTTFLLPPCIDSDGDGYNDLDPGELCLSYGSGEMKNMSLYYWVQVRNITKADNGNTQTLQTGIEYNIGSGFMRSLQNLFVAIPQGLLDKISGLLI